MTNTTTAPAAEKAKKRREQNRLAQAARRARLWDLGAQVIRIELTAKEYAEFTACRDKQNGPLESFALRALLTGARFVANAGTPKGRKVKGGAQ